jgi:hypothetical protein
LHPIELDERPATWATLPTSVSIST